MNNDMAILRLYSTDFSRREREHETELYQVLLCLMAILMLLLPSLTLSEDSAMRPSTRQRWQG